MSTNRKWYDGMFSTEDWWAFWIGAFFVTLGLIGAATNLPLTGWIVKFKGWVHLSDSLAPSYKGLLSPLGSLFVSYIIFTVVTAFAAKIMKIN